MRRLTVLGIAISLALASSPVFGRPLDAPTLTLDDTVTAPEHPAPNSFQWQREGWNLDLTYAYLGVHVQNMPVSIRDVPIHPDDLADFEGNGGPILETGYRMNNSVALGVMYAWQYGNDDLRLNLGFGFDWLALANVGLINSVAERNYSTDVGSFHHDDEDARLTYLGLRQVGVIPTTKNYWADIFLNWTPRAKIEIAPFHGPLEHLWLGASVSYYVVNAQTGWDREDNLQPRREYTFAHVIPVRLYATLFEPSETVGITAGVQLQPTVKTGLGKEADTSVAFATFFLSLSYRF